MWARGLARIGHRPPKRSVVTEKADFVDWEGFRRFLESSYSERTRITYWNYARRFCHLLLEGDFSPLKSMSAYRRHHVLESLAALSKFLGVYKKFRELRESYDVKWGQGDSSLLIIRRLLKAASVGNIVDWAKNVKRKMPVLEAFINFMFASGLRYGEALSSYNLIIRLSREKRLSSYYNNGFLEHYRFPKTFIRKTKKAILSIVPENIIESVRDGEPLTEAAVRRRLQRKRIPSRFGDIREYWASFMTRYLTPAEIDFLQGRIGGSVFMQHYFNPALITDLKTRVFRGLSELQAKIT